MHRPTLNNTVNFLRKSFARVFVLFSLCLSFLTACSWATQLPNQALSSTPLQVGAVQFSSYLPILEGQRVALVVNATSIVGEKHIHLADFLLEKEVDVRKVFAPEHGFRIDQGAGALVKDNVDIKTGLPIVSLYGKNKKPTAQMLSDVDVIVFDIQDVGTRFYTYISTMHYVMEAAAEQGKSMIVLDRPNPNGMFVDGPVLKPSFKSFVGMHPIPILHGLTVAELAKMIKGEQWINQAQQLQLTLVPVKHYTKAMEYVLPIAPSPNLPNQTAIRLYPSLCFFEATEVSVGRGTTLPFQVIGHDKIVLGDLEFTPKSTPGKALNPKLEGQRLYGQDLRNSNVRGLDLSFLIDVYQRFNEQNTELFNRHRFMDLLSGTDKLRNDIVQGMSEEAIRQTWQQDLAAYRAMREKYLIYPDY